MFAFKYLFKESFKVLSSRNGRELIKLMWLIGDKKRFTNFTVNFKGLRFKIVDNMSFLFQFKEIFIDKSYKFTPKVDKPLIIDCGANIGTSCAFFKKNYPNAQVIAIEADPEIAQILEENVKQNNITGVEIIAKAVWINDLGIEFAVEGADGASIFGKGNKVKVETIRLKNLLENYNSINLLKIDIEGAEYEVIKDCKSNLNHIENIFIEYHSYPNQEQKLNEILEILNESGFRYYINSPNDRDQPLINHYYKGNNIMDLQLNIFGYRDK